MFGGQKHFRMFFAVKVEVVVVSEKSLSSSFQPFLRPMDKIRNIIPHIQSDFRGSYLTQSCSKPEYTTSTANGGDTLSSGGEYSGI